MTDEGLRRIDVVVEPADDGWACAVTVTEGVRSTRHRVHVDRDVLARLAPGAPDPAGLVHASFDFLLAREPKESILPAFDLPLIGSYFPEYEAAIRRPTEAQRRSGDPPDV